DRIETLEILSSRMPLYDIIPAIARNDWNAEQGSILLSNLLFEEPQIDSGILKWISVLINEQHLESILAFAKPGNIKLFSRILLPMDDYEFFDGSKNPLKLQEVIEMSTYLKNIAFILYWNSPQLKINNVIEERHWLMTSEFDMSTFAKNVVADEQDLERENDKVSMDKRQESVSPRLGVLHNIPFVIPFDERVKIFRHFVRNDRDRLKNPVAIQFIDEFGMPEPGIDGGGLFKEFLTS
ncbi:3903_t:CDS:2, partial [Racocetra fulgida]